MSGSPVVSVSQRQALIAFLLGTLFFGYAFVQRVSPSVMTQELMREFAVGGAALGSLSAFYFYAYASIQLPVGMLTDRFGPRNLMSFAALLCTAATIGFAWSDSLLMASIGRAFIGATVAFAFVGTLAIAGYWFKASQYALLAGVLQSVGMFGAIFGQAPLRQLVEVAGWRGTMYLLAALAFLLAVLVFVMVPMRSSAQKSKRSSTGVMQGLRSVSTNLQTWICAVIGFGMAAMMLGFGGLWGVPWLASGHGYTTTEAAAVVSMIFFGWAVFSPVSGWLSDRIGKRNPIVIWGALLSLLSFAMVVYWTPENTALLMILIFLTGIGGSAMTITFGSVKELNDPDFSSTALGLMNMCVVGAGAVMQPLIGWMLDMRWDGTVMDGARVYSLENYTFAFSSLLVANLVALVAVVLLRETHCRPVR
ncbi:MAG: MFS transporter [Pseudomonadota bacterium]